MRKIKWLAAAAAVSVGLGEKALSVYDDKGGTHVPKGETTIFVGGGQPGFAKNENIKLSGCFSR